MQRYIYWLKYVHSSYEIKEKAISLRHIWLQFGSLRETMESVDE